MKKKTIIIIIIGIALLAVIKIFFLKKDDGSIAKQSGAQKDPVAIVTAFVTNTQTIENSLYSSGTILANEEVDLRSETSGKIISILFKEGSLVHKGQLLVKINDADLQAQLKKSTLNYKLSKEKEGRLKELLAIKGVSQEEYDVAFNQLQTITADMDYTLALIAKTEIRAPFDGVVGLKNVSEGSFVNPTDIIASMQQIDPVKVDFSIPEKYTAQIHINDIINVSIEGTGIKHQGTIYAIDPKIDVNTRALKVRALVDNRDRKIFPGSFAQIAIILKSEKSVVIPTMAVIPNLRGQNTFLIKNGKANLVPITIGIRTDTTVEVLNGLQSGDTIATSGIMALKQGMKVKIQSLKK